MAVTAQLVKELRERTGAGMLDCKKALVATEGNIDAAIDWLREKGIASAAKKGDRVAAEGLTNVYVDGNKAVIVEVNSETDFVAKNEQFLTLLDTVTKTVLTGAPASLEDALVLDVDGQSLSDYLSTATATIGEKITLRRFAYVEKTDGQSFASYKHMGGRISSLLVTEGLDEEFGKGVAMHAAAMAPQYLNVTDVDPVIIEREREIELERAKNDDALKTKPENVLKNIIEGRVMKQFQQVALLEQDFVVEPGKKVGQAVKEKNGTVVSFVRYEVGEGIEKRQDNFAEEVMAQVQGA